MSLVLLAEDDREVRVSIKMLLEDLGYQCLDFPNGDDALDALRKHQDAMLLVSDVQMPASDGRELLGILRKGPPRFRSMPVILISGAYPEKNVTSYINDDFCTFIKKPFTLSELEDAINGLLK